MLERGNMQTLFFEVTCSEALLLDSIVSGNKL